MKYLGCPFKVSYNNYVHVFFYFYLVNEVKLYDINICIFYILYTSYILLLNYWWLQIILWIDNKTSAISQSFKARPLDGKHASSARHGITWDEVDMDEADWKWPFSGTIFGADWMPNLETYRYVSHVYITSYYSLYCEIAVLFTNATCYNHSSILGFL